MKGLDRPSHLVTRVPRHRPGAHPQRKNSNRAKPHYGDRARLERTRINTELKSDGRRSRAAGVEKPKTRSPAFRCRLSYWAPFFFLFFPSFFRKVGFLKLTKITVWHWRPDFGRLNVGGFPRTSFGKPPSNWLVSFAICPGISIRAYAIDLSESSRARRGLLKCLSMTFSTDVNPLLRTP